MIFNSKYLIVLICWIFLSPLAVAQHISDGGNKDGNKVRFAENKNQWNREVLYRAQLDGGVLFLEKNSFTYNFYNKDVLRHQHAAPKEESDEIKNSGLKTHAFKVNFKNSSLSPHTKAFQPSTDYTNYFIGNDPSRWASKVRSYAKVYYYGIYSHINMEVLGLENSIKYNFIVEPKGDAGNILMNYEGVDEISIENDRLKIKTSINEIMEQKPYSYQWIEGKKIDVPCKFRLVDNTVSFLFENGYDKNYPLIIDPVLVFASYSGSYADNFGMTATYDEKGNLYAGGTAFNVGYPTTLGAIDTTYNGIVVYGRTDVVITKYDSTGSNLIYSTYLGGAFGTEIVTSLIVNAQDELFLYGATGSVDFPITANAYDTTFNGGKFLNFRKNATKFTNGTDIYVAKFNTSGTILLGSTFIGGSDNDGVNNNNIIDPRQGEYPYDSLQFNYGDQYRGEIMLDKSGNCYVASSTRSFDFPIVNGFDSLLGGQQDAIVFKFNSDLSSLLWSTYFGGSDNDAAYSLAVDDSSVVYVTGGTRSSTFPATSGVIGTSYNGGKADGFITKINKTGTAILNSTFIGTSSYDQSYFIQLDQNRNVYVYGQTQGSFPVTAGVYTNPNSGQFITKLNNSLDTIIYSTVFGNGNGKPNISPSAFLVDLCENVYISGWGGNIVTGAATYNMPLTADAFQSTTDGFNFYLMALSKDAKSLLYATYFGGALSDEHVDGGTSRFDKKGIIYQSVCAGCGRHSDFPTTLGAWSRTNNSNNCNNGVFKFDFQIKKKAEFTSDYKNSCGIPLIVSFTNGINLGVPYLWDFGNGDTTSVIANPTKNYSKAGTYLVKLVITDNSGCFSTDTVYKTITVNEAIQTNFSFSNPPCSGTVSFKDSSYTQSGALGSTWLWNFGDGNTSLLQNPTHNYVANGIYNASLITSTSKGCSDTLELPVKIALTVTSSPAAITSCGNNYVQFVNNSKDAGAYLWDFGNKSTTTDTSTLLAPAYLYPDTGDYKVTLIAYSGFNPACSNSDSIRIRLTPAVSADFDYDVNSCNNAVSFFDSSFTYGLSSTWSWNFGDGGISSSRNPIHTYSSTGNYQVSLVLNASNNCSDSLTIPIDIIEPVVSVSKDAAICEGKNIQLFASGGIAYNWTPSAGLNSTVISNPIASPDTTTIYTVSITSVTSNKDTCLVTKSIKVSLPDKPMPDLIVTTDKDTLLSGESTTLHASPDTGYIFSWTPTKNIVNENSAHPVVSPVETTTYSATITDAFGCNTSTSVKIYVIPSSCDLTSVFVPNTFTPNGDNNNDVLFVRGNEIEGLYFAVYNRWGEIVFETRDKSIGWDGMYKGEKLNPGVFAYYLKVICYNKKELFKKGNVTLIR